MKKCKSCNVLVNTDRKICPLCFNSLEEVDNEKLEYSLYPPRKNKKLKDNWFYKAVIFVCIFSIIISGIINILTHIEGEKWWSVYVVASVGYLFMLVRGVILTRTYVVKRLFIQLITISVLIYVIDLLSDNAGWSYIYVIPSISIATNITNGIITITSRKNFGEGFNSLFLSLLWGCIPFILYLFNIISKEFLLLPLFSFCISVAIILGIIVFGSNATKEELKKRFHL